MKKIYLISLFFMPVYLFAQKTILWQVTDSKNAHVSYLLGTNHLVNQSFVDSFPVIAEKLKQSELVITEVEKDPVRIEAYYNKRDSSVEFNKILKKDDLDLIGNILKYSSIKNIYKFTPGELFAKLSNYYVPYTLNIPTDKLFIDEYIQFLAKQNHLQQLYLEIDTAQLEMLKKATEPLDWNYFRANITSLLEKYRHPVPTSGSGYENYKDLNINYSFGKKCPEGILLKNRNIDWITKLEKIFTSQNCFMAVGLMHLDYECGLITKLKKLGFIVEPVSMN